MTTDKGLRYNEGKLRHDLVNPYAHEQMVKVLTKGAIKYEPRNWEKGMAWSKVIASLKRHLSAFEQGEDFDPETGELHMAHLACNAHFLTAYYKLYPQGDDRAHNYLSRPRIGLDIDEVLANFVSSYCETHSIETPQSWQFDYNIKTRLKESPDSFWLDILPKVKPSDIPFEPVVYISSRPALESVTQQWLLKHGFPAAPVVHTKTPEDKVRACQDHKVDIYVDDSFDNFIAINNAGICCFLFDAPHNQRYNVGFKRIKALSELTLLTANEKLPTQNDRKRVQWMATAKTDR